MVLSVLELDGDHSAPSPAVPAPPGDVQSTLLALLSKAVNGSGANGVAAG